MRRGRCDLSAGALSALGSSAGVVAAVFLLSVSLTCFATGGSLQPAKLQARMTMAIKENVARHAGLLSWRFGTERSDWIHSMAGSIRQQLIELKALR